MGVRSAGISHFSHIIALQVVFTARKGTMCGVMHSVCSTQNQTLAAAISEDEKNKVCTDKHRNREE